MALPTFAWARQVEPWRTLRQTVPLPPVVESGRQKVGDVDLYYAIYGKGAPVILLHPGLGHGDYWANQIGPLSQDLQVIVVDLRGHGRSTWSPRPLSYGLMAEDVTLLMRKLGMRSAAVVGWGDGANVGLEMALRHPGRVRELIAFGLTLDASGQQPNVDQNPTFVEYVHKAAADYRQMAPAPERFEAAFQQLEALWASPPSYGPEQLRRLRVPVTVMVAEHDEWVRPEHAQAPGHPGPAPRSPAQPAP